jgi:hypothetical protein
MFNRGSFAHGTPPYAIKNNYDVPFPNIQTLSLPNRTSVRYEQESACFVALCRITEILGDSLLLVYDLRTTPQDQNLKKLRRIETELDTWEEDVLYELIHGPEREDDSISGSASLHLCFFALRMLNCRIALHVSLNFDTWSLSNAAFCRPSLTLPL